MYGKFLTTLAAVAASVMIACGTAAAEQYFTLGSSGWEVLSAQGEADEINKYESLDQEVWVYGYDTVTISIKGDRVTEWDNSNGGLKAKLTPGPNVTDKRYITTGSNRDDVIRLHGTPTMIRREEVGGKFFETWNYGRCSIKMNEKTASVLEWDNRCGKLKVEMLSGGGETKSGTFTIGSGRDDVLRFQGTPDEVREYKPLGYETWHYGNSSIKISLRGKVVVEYSNSGNLNVTGPAEAVEAAKLVYHKKAGDVVLYYDDKGTYKNVFSFEDKEKKPVYGVTHEGVTQYYDNRMMPLNVASVIQSGREINVVPLKETISSQWLGEFKDSLGHLEMSGGMNGEGSMSVTNGMTVFDIMSDGGDYLDGISVEAGNLTFDQMVTGDGRRIDGDRIQVEGITFGSWVTPGGEVLEGASVRSGDDLIIHSYVGSDGKVYSGTTITIDDYTFTEFEEF